LATGVDYVVHDPGTALTDYRELTERERQVMKLVVARRVNKQIAAELGLSLVTVKVHRGQAMRKMQAKSVAELVRMAERLGVPALYTKV
jgi:FixJ family two-component response regulator